MGFTVFYFHYYSFRINVTYVNYMYRLIIFLLFMLSTISKAQLVHININPSFQSKGSVMLSDLVENIDYIPLETNDNCIVGIITSFDISENYIVLYVFQSKEVFLFKRNGKFVAKIGRQAQSNIEYISPKDVYIDELKNCIYVHDFQRLLIYDFSGKHIAGFSFDGKNQMMCNYWNNLFITGMISTFPNEDYYVYHIWNKKMELVKQGVKGIPINFKGGRSAHVSPPIYSYKYQNIPHFKESVLNDTVYYLNNNNEFIPKFIINCGRYGMTADVKADTERWNENSMKYIGGMRFFETSNFILIRYYYNGKTIPCYFEKRSKKLLYFNSLEGIEDDIAGGIDFWPSKQINNYLYAFYNAPDLLNIYKKQKDFFAKGPSSTVKKIESVIKKLDTEDNPVLIVAKIK